jgi:hypothetical protein
MSLDRGAAGERPLVVLGSLATIAGADYVIHRRTPRWLLIGVFDEPAHLATNVLVLLNLPPRSRAFEAGFLAGAVALDADHVPLALAPAHPGGRDPRPTTHSLPLVGAAAAAALVLPARARAIGLGLAAGSLGHLWRDLASGRGAALLWPLSHRHVRVPYWLYAATQVALAQRWRAAARRATLREGL